MKKNGIPLSDMCYGRGYKFICFFLIITFVDFSIFAHM